MVEGGLRDRRSVGCRRFDGDGQIEYIAGGLADARRDHAGLRNPSWGIDCALMRMGWQIM